MIVSTNPIIQFKNICVYIDLKEQVTPEDSLQTRTDKIQKQWVSITKVKKRPS